MALLEVVEPWAPNLSKVLRHDAWWMTWNTFLAWLPVALAFAVFRRRRGEEPLTSAVPVGMRAQPTALR